MKPHMPHRMKIPLLVVLSVAIPVLLRSVELTAAPLVSRVLGISPLHAADGVLVILSLAAAVLCIARIKDIGLGFLGIRLDIRTGILFLLTIAPAVIMAKGVSPGPGGIGFVTTAVSEELMCRGVWFSIAAYFMRKNGKFHAAYPVLLSSLFFVIWHVNPGGPAPSLFSIIGGVYTSLCLGMLRAWSGSLYPGIAAHMVNLLML